MLVYACKEKPTPKPEVCDVVTEAPEDFLNYFFYPEGSYWVYRQDSAGGLIDTLKIVRSNIGYFTVDHLGSERTGVNTAVYQIWVEHTNPFFYVEGKPLVACFTGYSTNDGGNWTISSFDHPDYSDYHSGDVLIYPIEEYPTYTEKLIYSSAIGDFDCLAYTLGGNYNGFNYGYIYFSNKIGLAMISTSSNKKRFWNLVDYKLLDRKEADIPIQRNKGIFFTGLL